MYKNVLVFYSRLPISSIKSKTRIGDQIGDQQVASKLGRALINDMLAEFNPFLEDEYDLVFYYKGDLGEFRTRYKYNIRKFVRTLSDDVQVGMTHIHGKMVQDYEKVIIVGSDIPLISKQLVKDAFNKLDDYHTVMVPVEDGGYGLFGASSYTDVYDKISNYKSRSEGYDLAQLTEQELNNQGLSLFKYDTLFDIDQVVDVQHLYREITQYEMLRPEYFYLQKTYDILQKHKNEFGL